MSAFLIFILLPLSFVIGIGASAIGVTAWMILVPILFVFAGVDLYLTLFISLLVDCGNALVMAVFAGQNSQLNVKTGLMLSCLAVITVLFGVYTGTTFIPDHKELFKAPSIFVNIMFGLGFIRRGYRLGKQDEDTSLDQTKSTVFPGRSSPTFKSFLIVPAVMFVGFQSGLFGIGGGMMYSIFLMFCLSVPTLKATGTAMLITLITTVVASAGIYLQIPAGSGFNRQWILLILSVIFMSMIGTILGARIAYSLSLKKLNYMIASVILSISVIALIQIMIITS